MKSREDVVDRFRFVAVVWGADFTDAFLKACLPSQLFPGNLVHFAKHSNSIYRIYTSDRDAKTIQESGVYRSLSAIMPVELAVISGMSYVGKYKAMTQCHAHFVRSTRDDDCALVFMSPDVVWADGAFARLLEITKSGKQGVAISTPRLARESFIPAFVKEYSKDGILQPIMPRQLVRIALDHLHPVTTSQFWGSRKNSSMTPSVSYWPVNQEGLLARQFHLFPLMIRPVDRDAVPTISVDNDYWLKACPDPADVYVVQDSDEMCAVDFTSVSDTNDLIKPGSQNVKEVTDWTRWNTHALHREFVKHKIRFHWFDLSENWRDVEQRSDAIVESILSLIDVSGNASTQHGLSRMRYFSPRFLAGKVRRKGVVGLLKQAISTLVYSLLRQMYGPSIRIRMATNGHYEAAQEE